MKKKYKIVFSPEALTDLKEAKKWYNEQQKGLGAKLVKDIRHTVGSIRANPQFSSVKYASIRIAYCKVFPYGIHYDIIEEISTVYILSIFHFNRKPFWMID